MPERGDAADHLVGGLVGEGDEQDLVRRYNASLDRVRGATADHPRLARAGAGQDEERAARGEDGLALGVVEVAE